MYSSLFEVSQWCKAVDLLGKRRKITLMFLFRRNKWLTRNGKKHIIFNKEVLIWRFFESWMGDHL
ncbi:hypothetical protein LINPERPRIM_LOCUS31323 [Linum perenne]